jgi:hypothetical protein
MSQAIELNWFVVQDIAGRVSRNIERLEASASDSVAANAIESALKENPLYSFFCLRPM